MTEYLEVREQSYNGVIQDWELKPYTAAAVLLIQGGRKSREAFCSCILALFLSVFDSDDW